MALELDADDGSGGGLASGRLKKTRAGNADGKSKMKRKEAGGTGVNGADFATDNDEGTETRKRRESGEQAGSSGRLGENDHDENGEGKKRKRKEKPELAAADRELLEKAGASVPPKKDALLTKIIHKFRRGRMFSTKGVQERKVKNKLDHTQQLFEEAALSAAKVEKWLLPSEAGFLEAEGVERTANFKQQDIAGEVDLASQRKAFDIRLPELGPYMIDYTRNGKHMVIAGRKGHLAIMEWKSSHLVTELQVKETVRDVKFLHNDVFFAAAQRKYAYIYDKRGLEIHCLKKHLEPLRLEFLPHHFLLASVNAAGSLVYQDTSTGEVAAHHKLGFGRPGPVRLNPWNAVLSVGHGSGVVTMWSPNTSSPLVSMLCHKGPLTALAFDQSGHHMVTTGMDGRVRMWDVRTLKPMHIFYTQTIPTCLEVSQRGLLAVGFGSTVQIFRDAFSSKKKSLYMQHRVFGGGAAIQDFAFCPFEDTMAIGHAQGISSILVPGSGEPNFDTFVANPFETVKQRREAEVHQLLDKLQPDSIVLNPDVIGTIRSSTKETEEEREEKVEAALEEAREKAARVAARHKAKGKSKPSRRHAKKQHTLVEAKKERAEEQQKVIKKMKKSVAQETEVNVPAVGAALARFVR